MNLKQAVICFSLPSRAEVEIDTQKVGVLPSSLAYHSDPLEKECLLWLNPWLKKH